MTEDVTRAVDPGGLDALAAGDLVTGDGFEEEAGPDPEQIRAEEAGPDPEQIRAELRARGHNPPKRGRIGKDWRALWESGETAEQLAAQPPGDGTGGVGPEDFEPDHARQVKPEQPPARPKARGLRDRLGLGDDTGPGKRKSGREKSGRRGAAPRHARVPLDRLGEGAFGMLARVTRVADPALSRTFTVEAPIAGVVIDRRAQGTVIDRVLQPVARLQAAGSVLGALLGLPAGVLMLEQAQTIANPQARAVREGLILGGMRECAVILAEFIEEDMADRIQREADRETRYAEADQMLQFILFGVQPGQAEDQSGAPLDEDQAAANVQQQATPGGFGGFMAPPPAGDPARPAYAHPYPPASPAAQLARRS
jgi:hypothetical protein